MPTQFLENAYRRDMSTQFLENACRRDMPTQFLEVHFSESSLLSDRCCAAFSSDVVSYLRPFLFLTTCNRIKDENRLWLQLAGLL